MTNKEENNIFNDFTERKLTEKKKNKNAFTESTHFLNNKKK